MAAHDISDGGFAAAAAEMAFGGGLGADLCPETGYAQDGISQAELLFGESPSRLLIEVDRERELAFRSMVAGLPVERVGFVSSGHDLTLLDGAGRELLREDIAVLLECWSGGEI
jgi:phosphoribosylformylglycinamidine synthase